MQRALVRALKLLAACSGPGCILYSIHLFEKYFELGKQSSDESHTVFANNHGVFRYITEAQDKEFRFFLGTGVVLLLGLFASIIVTKIRERRKPL